MAKFSIKAKPLSRRKKFALLGGGAAVVLVGGAALAVNAPELITAPQPAPTPRPIIVKGKAPTPTAPPVPFEGPARLAALDQLRAEIDEAKLRRDLAKLKAEEREADSGVTAGAGMSALPAFPAGAINSLMPPSLETPPLPPSRSTARTESAAPGADGVAFLEAWGAGNNIQARVSTSSGDRLVRVGDKLAGGKVTAISEAALTIRDAHGKARTFH